MASKAARDEAIQRASEVVGTSPFCRRVGEAAKPTKAEKDRDLLLRAIKQWRNATESRLRFLDSRGEAAKSMLKADRDLIEALERVDGAPFSDQSSGED